MMSQMKASRWFVAWGLAWTLCGGTVLGGYNPGVYNVTASAPGVAPAASVVVVEGMPVVIRAELISPGPYNQPVSLVINPAATGYETTKPAASTVVFTWDTTGNGGQAYVGTVSFVGTPIGVVYVKVVRALIEVDLDDAEVNGVRSGLDQGSLRFFLNGSLVSGSRLTLVPTTTTVDGDVILTHLRVTYCPLPSELIFPGVNAVLVTVDDKVMNSMDPVVCSFSLP